MADGYFVTPAQAAQVEMREGVYRRTMATTDELMVCEFFLVSGAVVETHSHPNDQTGYIVFGELEITIGAQTQVCHPGDSYAVPGGIPHSARSLRDTVTIDVFSPPRSDYLTEAR
jgi:quercetin dioxygenase-like cupin family protein